MVDSRILFIIKDYPMNFTVVREHRNFYRQHHWIECEGVLTAPELNRIRQGLGAVLLERSGGKAGSSDKLTAEEKFAAGRDSWRSVSGLKKILLGRGLAGIAAELTEHKPLRFGYDMLFPSVSSLQSRHGSYGAFLSTTPTLNEMSCLQGVVCGAMLCIDGPAHASDENGPTSLFSSTPGNGVFFSPDWPLPLHDIFRMEGSTYLLIVYTKANAVYLLQERDPHAHALKDLGYNFGDRLSDPHHPVVYT